MWQHLRKNLRRFKRLLGKPSCDTEAHSPWTHPRVPLSIQEAIRSVFVQDVSGEQTPVYFISRTSRDRDEVSDDRVSGLSVGDNDQENEGILPKSPNHYQNWLPHRQDKLDLAGIWLAGQ